MPSSCSVCGCSGRQVVGDKSVRFFRFPIIPEIREVWVRSCYRGDEVNPDTGRICSDHFTMRQFDDNLKMRLLNPNLCDDELHSKLQLKLDAIPDCNLPSEAENSELGHQGLPAASSNSGKLPPRKLVCRLYQQKRSFHKLFRWIFFVCLLKGVDIGLGTYGV